MTYTWDTNEYKWRTNEVQKTYQWSTNKVQKSTNEVQMTYKWSTNDVHMRYKWVQMTYKWSTNDVRIKCSECVDQVQMIERWSTNELEMYKCINVSMMFDETYQEQCRQQWWLKSQLLTHKYSNQQLHTETHCPRRYQPARTEARFMICSSTLKRLLFTLYRIWAFSADTKSYPVQYEHLSDMWISSLEIGVAELRPV